MIHLFIRGQDGDLSAKRGKGQGAKARRLGMETARGRVAGANQAAKEGVGALALMAQSGVGRLQDGTGSQDYPALPKGAGDEPRPLAEAGSRLRKFGLRGAGHEDQVVKANGRRAAWPVVRNTKAAETRREQFFQKHHDLAVAGQVRELDLVDVDMSPAALLLVNDFNVGGPPFADCHVPHCRFEPLVVLAGGGANDFAINHEADLCIGVVAPAHQEPDETPLDGEGLADEAAGRGVAIEKTVDQAVAEEPGDRLLIGERAVGRLFAEGLALDLPVFVAVFEVLEEDVGPRRCLGDRFAPGPGGVSPEQRHGSARKDQRGPGLDSITRGAQEGGREVPGGVFQPDHGVGGVGGLCGRHGLAFQNPDHKLVRPVGRAAVSDFRFAAVQRVTGLSSAGLPASWARMYRPRALPSSRISLMLLPKHAFKVELFSPAAS